MRFAVFSNNHQCRAKHHTLPTLHNPPKLIQRRAFSRCLDGYVYRRVDGSTSIWFCIQCFAKLAKLIRFFTFVSSSPLAQNCSLAVDKVTRYSHHGIGHPLGSSNLTQR